MSESPANDLPPKYEDLLTVEQQGAGSGAANQSAAGPSSGAPSASSSTATGGAAAAAVRGKKSIQNDLILTYD